MKLKTTLAENSASGLTIRGRQIAAALFLLASHGAAVASCGSAFCSINTDWNAQTLWTENATQLDLRMEYIKQDQLRAGKDKTTASGEVGEHDEIETRNRNVIATLSHAVSSTVSLTLSMPVVSRDHSHIHNGVDGPELESWDFTQLGDVRASAYWRLDEAQSPSDTVYGLVGGIKLPTGSTDQRNAAGEAAERSLQPGTGSTDLIIGGFASGRLEQAGWFTQLRWQHAVSERQGFEPGDAVNLDMGMSYPIGAVQALAQINMLWREQDRGVNAEPALSGGTFIYFAPGLLVPIGHDVQLYGLVQFPLLQDVRGTQLTADWAASLGLTVRF